MSRFQEWEENQEIQLFREYLRIPSMHPNPDYEPCIAFLRRQATDLGLPISVIYPTDDGRSPAAVITWSGTDPALSSILLNSHMDVVPVFQESWTRPAFGAEMDDEGRIYARGSQDMKCVGLQYLAAIRALRADGVQPRRTVHVSFVPDEETGGDLGMQAFLKSSEFAALNVGFALDEGIASPTDVYSVFYAERSDWSITFHCNGTPGNGSLLHKNTSGEKVSLILNKFQAFREQEVQKLGNDPTLTIGDVSTINLTMIKGGDQVNVVPPQMNLSFDVRLAIDVSHDRFEEMIQSWCKEAGPGVDYEFGYKFPFVPPTSIDESNVFWTVFQSTIVDQLKLKIKTQVFPGATDSALIRLLGIPAIGFSPIDNTPVLLHGHDEFLSADTYLKGISIYRKLIHSLANTP